MASNYTFWFDDPFSPFQLISWILLIISAYLVIHGAILLVKKGKPAKSRNDAKLYMVEQTTQLIDHGIFKYIRHPLYSSLLFLTWGIFFKNITISLLLVALLSTLFLYLTAVVEEKECTIIFGDPYKAYMKQTHMFIPFVI
jgi:protein-S-isoprenylcysteine O-methyltransferase Ste14